MRFWNSVFLHESIVLRPLDSHPKNSFPVFGEFSELLANSVLLSASKKRKVKILSLVDQIFFLENHNTMQVQMMHVLFILTYCVLAAVKLFKIYKFAFMMSQFTFHV